TPVAQRIALRCDRRVAAAGLGKGVQRDVGTVGVVVPDVGDPHGPVAADAERLGVAERVPRDRRHSHHVTAFLVDRVHGGDVAGVVDRVQQRRVRRADGKTARLGYPLVGDGQDAFCFVGRYGGRDGNREYQRSGQDARGERLHRLTTAATTTTSN